MTKKYYDFEIPKNLIFNTRELIDVLPLKCSVKLDVKNFENILSKTLKLKETIVKLNFTGVGKEILAGGIIEGKISTQCSRCLKEIESEFSEEFYETLSTTAKEIDIMNIIQQTLARANEIQYLCSSECKGLCFICGENQNIKKCKCEEKKQSPFAVLKDKFDKKNKKEK